MPATPDEISRDPAMVESIRPHSASPSDDPMTSKALEITNLSKTFGGQVVLDRVNLTVGEQEIHGLVGRHPWPETAWDGV